MSIRCSKPAGPGLSSGTGRFNVLINITGGRNSSEDRKGCWREGNRGDRVPQEQRSVTVEEFRLKHVGRNVPPPPLLSPHEEVQEELEEEEDEEGREVTWVKGEVGPSPV